MAGWGHSPCAAPQGLESVRFPPAHRYGTTTAPDLPAPVVCRRTSDGLQEDTMSGRHLFITSALGLTGLCAGLALCAATAGAQTANDRKDLREDRQDVRQDTRDIRQDRRDIRRDSRDIRQDRRDIR